MNGCEVVAVVVAVELEPSPPGELVERSIQESDKPAEVVRVGPPLLSTVAVHGLPSHDRLEWIPWFSQILKGKEHFRAYDVRRHLAVPQVAEPSLHVPLIELAGRAVDVRGHPLDRKERAV